MLQRLTVHGFRMIAACATTLGFCSNAFAWGRTGHEAIALLAAEHMSKTALASVQQFLGTTDMREASVWPDKVRYSGAWTHSKTYHFTQVPDGESYFSALEDMDHAQRQKADALRAMLKAEDTLRDANSIKEDKTFALMFLIHLVGDIHQPLHTGRPEDLGGNTIKLRWFDIDSNVHSVIDSGVIYQRMQVPMAPHQYKDDEDETADESRVYLSMLTRPSPKEVSKWLKGTYLEWHNESQQLRLDAYKASQMENAQFVAFYRATVDQRILMAGYRLADMLNKIFDHPRDIDRDSQELRNKMSKVLGRGHERSVVLRPKNREMAIPYYLEPADVYECHHE